jgi:hypothetical protein
MNKIIKDVINFFSHPDETAQAEPKKPQAKPKAAKEKTYTFKDLEFRHDNRSGMTYAAMKFNNGYRMYISVKDYTEDWAHREYLKHEAPSGYEIKIVDSKGRENGTCLNKDGKNLIAYNKNAVTTLMKQIQQLDENGHLSAKHNAAMIEARKKHILKMRERREADKKNHPENAVSGTKVADDIAAAVISGSEKREITPSVALEYRKKLSRDQ